MPTFAGAAILGALVGAGSMTTTSKGREAMSVAVTKVSVAGDIVRQRAPQSGDAWGGCNDAREAGTSPIYRSEPGYRPEMDGDDDGIACE